VRETWFNGHKSLSRRVGVACDNMDRAFSHQELSCREWLLAKHPRQASSRDLEENPSIDELECPFRVSLDLFVPFGVSKNWAKSSRLQLKKRLFGVQRPSDEWDVYEDCV
jgi:hypothetical protein